MPVRALLFFGFTATSLRMLFQLKKIGAGSADGLVEVIFFSSSAPHSGQISPGNCQHQKQPCASFPQGLNAILFSPVTMFICCMQAHSSDRGGSMGLLRRTTIWHVRSPFGQAATCRSSRAQKNSLGNVFLQEEAWWLPV